MSSGIPSLVSSGPLYRVFTGATPQRQLSRLSLLLVDEMSPTGADLLFEVFSQRYERCSILVTTNLPFDEWTAVFGSKRLTGALLDRLTHHVHILEMNGDSYRLKGSRQDAAASVDRARRARWRCIGGLPPGMKKLCPREILQPLLLPENWLRS